MIAFALLIAVLAAATIVLAMSSRVRRFVQRFEDPGRIPLLSMAILVWTAGIIFFNALTFDDNDNAYLGLALLGVLMVPVGLAFLVEAVLPAGQLRRWGALITLGMFWTIGLFSLVLLTWALIVIPGQNYRDNDPFIAHLLGVVLVAILLVSAATLFRPAPRH